LREDAYIRPLAFKAEPVIKVTLEGIADAFGLFVLPFGEYLPLKGIRVITSSWRRIDDNAIPARAKVTGSYINTALAVSDAHAAGFDDCIFLNPDGHVSEGSAANLFMVRDGTLVTPPITDNLLEGITRHSLMVLARDRHLPMSERHIDRSELYVADEVFLAGTGVQVVPVVEIDSRRVGAGHEGPVTQMLKEAYLSAARGDDPGHRDWLTAVDDARED
jgi:branched-chain amino acid aminotransferase